MFLQDKRKEKGLTQQQLSEISGVKIVTIQKLENGTNNILGAKTETTYKLATALGVTIEDLIDK
jgi:transcriptional regulator with XRE-family HTH domain